MTEKALKGLHSSIDLVFKELSARVRCAFCEDPARKDYALKALAVHGRALQFLAPQLRADKEVGEADSLWGPVQVVLKAVGSDGWALQWADKELYKRFCFAVVQECRKDKELVTKARPFFYGPKWVKKRRACGKPSVERRSLS